MTRLALRHLEVGQGVHETITASIRDWLAIHAQLYANQKRPGDLYTSSEELVLLTGKSVNANFNDMGRFVDMPRGQCFENAFKISSKDRRWRYTEGWACSDRGIPTHHAWLTGPDGEIEDPTWRGMYAGFSSDCPVECNGNAVFWGISPDADDHLRWAQGTGYPNILAVYDCDAPSVRRFGLEALKMESTLEGAR